MNRKAELADIDLVDFGLPSAEPQISAELYLRRISGLVERARNEHFDFFIVYGDREHFANMRYLTGYDPRFEEALFILPVANSDSRKPLLLVGNEGLGYANSSPIIDEMDVVLYQTFSLLGQDRSESDSLAEILADAGIGEKSSVGTAGWKHFDDREFENPDTVLDCPSFIADELRSATGDKAHVKNGNYILMDSSAGMRSINEIEQLACFEFAASRASLGVKNVLFGLTPGMSEYEAAHLLGLTGMPLSCHAMLSSGNRAFLGMGSPSSNLIQPGDAFTAAVGLWGALTCRAGFVVESPLELPENIRDYVDKLVAPYFQAIAAWYESVGIGVTGGELYKTIHDRIGDPFFGVALNPGHLIHLDEWVDSPIYKDSSEVLKSGMALQVDVIPATGTDYFTTNIEEGIALADEATRDQLREDYPDAWARIEARRDFMLQAIGIRLKPEVLPFSNIPAYLPPFLLAPRRAMRLTGA
ncbi:MAG: hypothetical protein CMN78_02700 [Spirochaetales bacterium]|nr:hypothetical protein [Spirochaetales bacterium]